MEEVKRVIVHSTYFENDLAGGKSKILDQLSIQVHFKNPSQDVLNRSVYNSEYCSDLLGEIVLAASWAELINLQLTK